MKLNKRQALALKYYKAYGALCFPNDESYSQYEKEELRVLRNTLFMYYKIYDPDNSFDVGKDYE